MIRIERHGIHAAELHFIQFRQFLLPDNIQS